MNTARRIEAVTRLDVAIDQLLTAYLLSHEQDLLTEKQEALVKQVLDLLDTDGLVAMRLAVGINTYGEGRLVEVMERDLRWRDHVTAPPEGNIPPSERLTYDEVDREILEGGV